MLRDVYEVLGLHCIGLDWMYGLWGGVGWSSSVERWEGREVTQCYTCVRMHACMFVCMFYSYSSISIEKWDRIGQDRTGGE